MNEKQRIEYYRSYREKNREKVREYQREYKRKNKRKYREVDRVYQARRRKNPNAGSVLSNRRWIAENLEKVRAQQTLNLEVKRGKINRGTCVECGAERTHGHHPDYSKPLQVIWLCSSHHKLLHLKEKQKRLTTN